MKNYREQNGCHNCEFCFMMCDYDTGTEFYCTEGAPERPPCMSLAMRDSGEYPVAQIPNPRKIDFPLDPTEKDYIYDPEDETRKKQIWKEWSKGREIAPWGICDLYEEAPQNKCEHCDAIDELDGLKKSIITLDTCEGFRNVIGNGMKGIFDEMQKLKGRVDAIEEAATDGKVIKIRGGMA